MDWLLTGVIALGTFGFGAALSVMSACLAAMMTPIFRDTAQFTGTDLDEPRIGTDVRTHRTQHEQQCFRIGLLPALCHVDV